MHVDLDLIRRTNTDAAAGPLSINVRLPFCRELCYYCGCTMKVTHDPDRIATYLDYLHRDIDRMAAALHPERTVIQMHWGSGTPTHLAPEQIEALGTHLRARF